MKPHYEQMARFLWSSKEKAISLTFEEIEGIVLGRLPKSARRETASWSNNPGGFGLSRMWLAAGYHSTSIDLRGERVTFHQVKPASISDSCWRGVVGLALGVDLPVR